VVDRPPRTLLEHRIRQQHMTYEEFVHHAEGFARDHHESGTLSLRHLQRLASGQLTGSLRPATARLLEHLFGEPIAALLASPKIFMPLAGRSRVGESRCHIGYMGHFSLIGTYFRLRTPLRTRPTIPALNYVSGSTPLAAWTTQLSLCCISNSTLSADSTGNSELSSSGTSSKQK
jgi:hypothetical protein